MTLELIEPDGTHVAWLPATYSWRDEADGPGSVTAQINRTAPELSDITYRRRLRVWHEGVVVQTGRIEPRSDQTVDQAEEVGEFATVGGRGWLADLEDATVEPLAPDLKPKQSSLHFTFAHPAFDDSAWLSSVDMSAVANMPEEWPGGGTPIFGPGSDGTTSPAGPVWFRDNGTFTLATETVVAPFWYVDNIGSLYLDGVLIDRLENYDGTNYTQTHEAPRITLSAGTHRWAGDAFNVGPSNAGVFQLVVYDLATDGTLGSIIYETTTGWVSFDDEPPRPSWTIGQILTYLLAVAEGTGFPAIARTWDALVDSNGDPWATLSDWTVQVGDSGLAAVMALAENHIDLRRDPDTGDLYAWNKGGMGTVADVDLDSGYNDPVNGCITSLDHQAEPPQASRLLVGYRDGYVVRVNQPAIDAGDFRSQFFELADAPLADAERVGDNVLDLFSRERVQYRAGIRPRISGQTPFVDYLPGDTRNLPNREGTLEPIRVNALTGTVDANGVVSYELEGGDRVLVAQERFNQWLGRTAAGTLGGRTMQALPWRGDGSGSGASKPRGRVGAAGCVDAITIYGSSIDAEGNIEFTYETPGSATAAFDVPDDCAPVSAVTVPVTGRWHCHVWLILQFAAQPDAGAIDALLFNVETVLGAPMAGGYSDVRNTGTPDILLAVGADIDFEAGQHIAVLVQNLLLAGCGNADISLVSCQLTMHRINNCDLEFMPACEA